MRKGWGCRNVCPAPRAAPFVETVAADVASGRSGIARRTGFMTGRIVRQFPHARKRGRGGARGKVADYQTSSIVCGSEPAPAELGPAVRKAPLPMESYSALIRSPDATPL